MTERLQRCHIKQFLSDVIVEMWVDKPYNLTFDDEHLMHRVVNEPTSATRLFNVVGSGEEGGRRRGRRRGGGNL